MSTPTTRRQHNRDHLRYGSDLTDLEWEMIAPYMPPPAKTGRPRSWTLREIMNAIFYVLRAGCAWSLLPKDFPPRSMVYGWFLRFPRYQPQHAPVASRLPRDSKVRFRSALTTRMLASRGLSCRCSRTPVTVANLKLALDGEHWEYFVARQQQMREPREQGRIARLRLERYLKALRIADLSDVRLNACRAL